MNLLAATGRLTTQNYELMACVCVCGRGAGAVGVWEEGLGLEGSHGHTTVFRVDNHREPIV